MIQEYLKRLIEETDEELNRLQKQMAELIDELNYSKEKQIDIQRKRNKDISIFSPRSMSQKVDDKLVKVNEEVKTNNQHVEYIRERIEISTKKKMEYQTLLDELQKNDENEFLKEEKKETETSNKMEIEEKNATDPEQTLRDKETGNQTGKRGDSKFENESKISCSLKNTLENLFECRVEEIEKEQKVASESKKEEIAAFLEDIYKSTEICLAFVNGDKNQCRKELKKMKDKIKLFSEEMK